MRRATAAVVAAVAVLTVAGVATPWLAGATSWIPLNWAWSDLTPSGDRHIVYATCGGGVGAPAEWAQGVEAWDTAMASLMEFDTLGCALPPVSQTVLTWEGMSPYQHYCDFGTSCWVPWSWFQDGLRRRLLETAIVSNYEWYMHASTGWRTTISAHEWGHNLNLDEDPADMCAAHVLMGVAPPPEEMVGNPCVAGPSPTESGCVAQFYGWTGCVDRDSDPDSDGDLDAVDSLFALQYVVGWRTGSSACLPLSGVVCLPHSDANLDGRVDAVDALFILQHVVGMRSLCTCGAT